MKYTLLKQYTDEFDKASDNQKEEWILEFFHQQFHKGYLALSSHKVKQRFNSGLTQITLDYMWRMGLLNQYNNNAPSEYDLTEKGFYKIKNPRLFWLKEWGGHIQAICAIGGIIIGATITLYASSGPILEKTVCETKSNIEICEFEYE